MPIIFVDVNQKTNDKDALLGYYPNTVIDVNNVNIIDNIKYAFKKANLISKNYPFVSARLLVNLETNKIDIAIHKEDVNNY